MGLYPDRYGGDKGMNHDEKAFYWIHLGTLASPMSMTCPRTNPADRPLSGLHPTSHNMLWRCNHYSVEVQ